MLSTEQWLKKASRVLAWAGVALAGGVFVWAAVRWVLPLCMPFFVAFGLAFLLRRPVRFLARTAGIRRRPAAGLLLCLSAAAVLGGAGYLVARLLLLAKLVLARLPVLYTDRLEPLLSAASQWLNVFSDGLLNGEMLLEPIAEALRQLAAGLAGAAGGLLTALPGLLLPFVFACIATVYFTLEYERLMQLVARRLGAENCEKLQRLWVRARSLAGRLARAYILLFGLTFVQLCIGFWLLGVSGAAGAALLVALVDVLPVLGVGTVLLPWAAVCACSGRGGFALGLLVLYAVVWVVRQICEPKLLSRQLGLHPLVSLFFLYAGLRLFGVAGAVFLPAAVTLVWQLCRKPPGASDDFGQ